MTSIAKKISSLMIAGILCAGFFTGCGSTQPAPENGGDTPAKEQLKIGIIQLVEHGSLDAAREGFINRLSEQGYVNGENLTIDYQNAQGDQSNCMTIAQKFANDHCDLVLAISTPASQAMVSATTEIPILVSCVTDPAASKLLKSNDAPGGNVSGVSDLTPVDKQIELLHKMVPDAKTVGLLYSSSESNSQLQIEMAAKKCEELGLKTVTATVSNSNEIQQVTESLIGKSDVIYSPSDNMIASSIPTVTNVTEAAKIPFIVGVEEMVKDGGTATLSLDYYKMGQMAANQAVSILKDGADISSMPVEYQTDDLKLVINEEKCKKIGLEIPEDLRAEADVISPTA